MKRKDLLKIALLITTGWLALPSLAQDSFTYKAPIDTISEAGFYRVILTPEVLAKCNNRELSDIRISHAGAWPGASRNVSGGSDNAMAVTFIPYVLKTDFPTYQGESFIEFPILPTQKGDSAGDVRIGNWSGGPIHSLWLYVYMSDVWRSWTLSGSNDGKKWYIIREHIRQMPSHNDNSSFDVRTIDFPSSDYHYFKIIQEDKGVLPLNIYRAGVITRQAGTKRYRPIPPPSIAQKDSSNHHSYITLSFREPYMIEYLKLYIKAPKLYKRQMLIKRDLTDNTQLGGLDLEPANTSIDLEGLVKRTSILLDIDNEDNAPLVIDSIAASQKERYLLTWLEPGKYELLVGDKHALTPKYDLKYFVDTVSREPAAILPGPLTSTNIHPLIPGKPQKDYKGVYLWAAIIVVLLLLIWLCLNMLKSIRESRQ